MAQRLYRPAHGACTHSHRTVVAAIECARNLHSDLDIVALKNGHTESLNDVEERIRSAALTLYDKTGEEILDVHNRTEARSGSVASHLLAKTEKERFDVQWGESLSGFTEAEKENCYTRLEKSSTIALSRTASLLHFPKPYTNQYKCPHGNSNRGEKAVYCGPCNNRYEEFLLIINDDR